MKLLSSFQLATHPSIATVQASFFVSAARWQDPIWKNSNNNEISDGVSVLLVVYWTKEKPSNWGLSYRLDIRVN